LEEGGDWKERERENRRRGRGRREEYSIG